MMKSEKAANGRAAQSFRDTFENVFNILEAGYLEQSIESEFEDKDLREHIYHRIRVLKDFKRIMGLIIADGKIADAELIRMSKIESGEKKEFY